MNRLSKDIVKHLKKLMSIDSPSGFTFNIINALKKEIDELGFKTYLNNKGNLIVEVGEGEEVIGFCGHVDTLGLMVRSIKNDGTLSIVKVGGPLLPTLDGEYCKIYTRNGKQYTGTILSNSPSVHVYKDADKLERNDENMSVRIDEVVKSKEDVEKLGINAGDFIAYDPKTTITESGFIKSRFLDDKLSVAILLEVLYAIYRGDIKLDKKVYFLISTYEEVGHGCSFVPKDIQSLIAVDMGCIGLDLNCSEYDVSICAKDSSGPYDYSLTNQMIAIAEKEKLNYAIDIYPFYGSDVSSALRGGNDIKGALIGPGVAASHGMERTHIDAVINTYKLIESYLNGVK